MDFQELSTFLVIARTESFSAAADRLGYSQAAITIRIKNLENELGVRLFDRMGKKISLTRQGERLYEQAVPLLHALSDIKQSMAPAHQPEGRLSVGTIDSMSAALFPGMMKKLRQQYPRIQVSITTDTPQRLFEMLKNNEIDLLYLIDEKVTLPWTKVLTSVPEEIIMAADGAHPLADGRTHTPEELSSCTFMLTEPDASYRKPLDAALTERGLSIHPLFESNNTELLLQLLPGSGAITFLPAYTLSSRLQAGTMQEIRAEGISARIYRQLIIHKDKWINEEMKAFMELCIPTL